MKFSFGMLTAALLASSATASYPKMPNTGKDWVTLQDGVEFQPAMNNEDTRVAEAVEHARLRFLSGMEGTASSYESQFIDGSETYYSIPSQAWRYLGFMVDCNMADTDENQDQNRQYDTCGRYLLWAAYIDLGYQGGGLAEYQIFDPATGAYDTTGCSANTVNDRCVKMDCHEEGSNWALLGYFKELEYREWMEQTFKHMGVCIWDDDTADMMQSDREIWPEACTATGIASDDGNSQFYIDMMPLPEGRFTIGLYTDATCAQVYGGEETIEYVLYAMEYGTSAAGLANYNQNEDNDDGQNNEYQGGRRELARRLGGNDNGGSYYDLEETMADWHRGFDYFKVCQPCQTYTPAYKWSGNNTGANDFNGGDTAGQMGPFQCQDVSQCMKFATHTKMTFASFNDIMLAGLQGSITKVSLNKKYTIGYGGFSTNNSKRWGFFACSLAVLIAAVLYKKKSDAEESEDMKEPFVGGDYVVA